MTTMATTRGDDDGDGDSDDDGDGDRRRKQSLDDSGFAMRLCSTQAPEQQRTCHHVAAPQRIAACTQLSPSAKTAAAVPGSGRARPVSTQQRSSSGHATM